MKRILVGIKRVVDFNVRIRVKPDGSGVITDGVKMSINPFDEIALEEALRIKERGAADEVIVATVGPADTQQQLRSALAMGADRALHVQADGVIEPLVAARVLLKLVEREQPMLVILGKQGIDDDNGQTGQVLAALWRRPQATYASKVELSEGGARATEGGWLSTPAAAAEGHDGQGCRGAGRGAEAEGALVMAKVLIVAEH